MNCGHARSQLRPGLNQGADVSLGIVSQQEQIVEKLKTSRERGAQSGGIQITGFVAWQNRAGCQAGNHTQNFKIGQS